VFVRNANASKSAPALVTTEKELKSHISHLESTTTEANPSPSTEQPSHDKVMPAIGRDTVITNRSHQVDNPRRESMESLATHQFSMSKAGSIEQFNRDRSSSHQLAADAYGGEKSTESESIALAFAQV
jgi:hypothetical protein